MSRYYIGFIFILLSIIFLSADDSFEPNDTMSQAKEINIGTLYHLNASNKDWFSVNLNSGNVQIVMTPLSDVDLNMILYNKNGDIVASNFSDGREIINYNVVNSGKYYISVEPTTKYSSDYTLKVESKSNLVWEKKLNFGPIRDVSVALYDIDNDGKDEIFIGTSKALDSNLNEIRPAGLICLEDDGTVKWTRTFSGMFDNQTGKTYNTTSVSTAPFFSDIDGDNSIDIIVGVGADTMGEAGPYVVGQPGDKGGIYALDANGNIKWFHESLDIIGGDNNLGDGRPDGVYGTPIVYDIDRDGKKEVIYNSWDQHTWILDAKTGKVKRHIDLLDTIWSTPKIADINNDGKMEILVSADITENPDAQVKSGGVFHVISANGEQNIPGFDKPIGNPKYNTLRGKYEEQPLWSSPQTADLDNDGKLEIIYGTGNFFQDGRGEYVRVWNSNGTNRFKLNTQGRTFATPLIADINNDGKLEIVEATLDGYIYAWNGNGQQLFSTKISNNPIFSSPIAVDINNDGKLEIVYDDGAQITIIDSNGNKISKDLSMVMHFYKGAPAIRDIDNDGILNLISGGTTANKDQAVVYNWNLAGSKSDARVGRYQFIGADIGIENFVKRFYRKILNREAEPAGLNYWKDRLVTGIGAGSDIARGFIFSEEFNNRNTTNDEYLTILYRAFFNREPDNTGFNDWLGKLNRGVDRAKILDGFLYSQEFANLCRAYSIIAVK
jgi:hypothetical protein